MRTLDGKVAVITGGGGGLGLALARQCSRRGMRLVLADVDPAALDSAAAALGGDACATRVTDVRKPESVQDLARFAYDRFGAVHLLFNNAGVGLTKPVVETTANDWAWLLGVNLGGVINGVAAFLPRMLKEAEESRIVNTASAAGFLSEPGMAAYSVSKHGVVVLSETLRNELARSAPHVGVTVLCPAFFPSGISSSERVRPPELAGTAESVGGREVQERLDSAVRKGRITADDIAAQALEAILAGDFYVFTHKKIRLAIEERFRGILDACPYVPRS